MVNSLGPIWRFNGSRVWLGQLEFVKVPQVIVKRSRGSEPQHGDIASHSTEFPSSTLSQKESKQSALCWKVFNNIISQESSVTLVPFLGVLAHPHERCLYKTTSQITSLHLDVIVMVACPLRCWTSDKWDFYPLLKSREGTSRQQRTFSYEMLTQSKDYLCIGGTQ